MMISGKASKPCLIGSLLLLVLIFSPNLVHGQTNTTDSVDATIKISVCGDSVIEGSEDCEGSDLNGQTCISLGYVSGILACDIACTFDTTDCIAPTPTPTPTPISSPTSTPTVTPVPVSTSVPTGIPAPISTETPTPIPVPVLPRVVSLFDLDNSGRIEAAEVFEVIKDWVEERRKEPERQVRCDLNQDNVCDLVDFSILLYYIER